MLITLLIMKLTFDGILKECNRLAFEQEMSAYNAHLKSRLARLEIDYHKGTIDIATYQKKQSEVLQELDNISKKKIDNASGDTSVEI